MENQIKSERNIDGIQAKINVVNDVKNKFNQIIKRKIGNLLVNEISKVIENDNLNQNQDIILKLPRFFKSIFNFYKNDKLLIETSLLYIIYSLGLMNPEMQTIYEKNIVNIEVERDKVSEVKALIMLNLNKPPEFICKIQISPLLDPFYSLFKKQFQNLVIFGLFKIFEWLNVLNTETNLEITKYEQSFVEVLQNVPKNV